MKSEFLITSPGRMTEVFQIPIYSSWLHRKKTSHYEHYECIPQIPMLPAILETVQHIGERKQQKQQSSFHVFHTGITLDYNTLIHSVSKG